MLGKSRFYYRFNLIPVGVGLHPSIICLKILLKFCIFVSSFVVFRVGTLMTSNVQQPGSFMRFGAVIMTVVYINSIAFISVVVTFSIKKHGYQLKKLWMQRKRRYPLEAQFILGRTKEGKNSSTLLRSMAGICCS